MTNKEALKKLAGILKKYWNSMVLIIVGLIISSGINAIAPIINSKIIDKGFLDKNWKYVILLILLTLICYLINSTIEVVKERKRLKISSNIKMNLEKTAFLHLMKVRLSFFDDKNYAEILGDLNTDITNISLIAEEPFFYAITGIFSMIGGFVGLFILDTRLAIIVLLFLPLKFVVMKFLAKKKKAYIDSYIMDVQDYSGWFGDAVGGVKEIRAFGIQKNKMLEFSEKKGNVLAKDIKIAMLDTWNFLADNIIVQIMTALIYILGANYVISGSLSVGNVFAFINYSVYVTNPISAILNIGYYMSGIIPSTKRFYEFMSYAEELENDDTVILDGSIDKVGITFDDVSFSYNDETCILNHVSFKIMAGKKTVLVGDNGAGKSTIIDLILRFYEPQGGRILLGKHRITDYSVAEYREFFSIVSQNIYLFDDTIAANVTMYRNVSNEDLINACRLSGLLDFINEVSLDYRVGNNGIMLSGGQKQKIAMARALIKNSPIFVFDEATSNVDSESIRQINSLLHTALKRKTVIVVSHQTDILEEADQVYEVKGGRVIELKI